MNKDTLNIWMHNLKNVTYFPEWSPTECETDDAPIKAMQVLGGDQWNDVYELMTEKRVVVVGGNAQSVSTSGGYLQGGGHSCNSPLHGLAVDNLLEVDIVIADGTLLTVNKCWHPDLFWAIRGGGGGTFGIVTRAVYKAHEIQEMYFGLKGTLLSKNECTDCQKKLVRAYVDWMAWTTENQPGLWGGYNPWGPYGNYTALSIFVVHFGWQYEAQKAINIFDDLVE